MMDFLFRKAKETVVHSEGTVHIQGKLCEELAALTFTQCIEISRNGRVYRITLQEDRAAVGKSEGQK